MLGMSMYGQHEKKIFDKYSEYYDLLYADKDYQGETDYLASLIDAHAPQAKTILELGCGTGKHAHLLTEKGYSVFGVDLSETMLDRARTLGVECALGDARTFRNNKIFDVALSLFHVASYQTTNEDLTRYFETASHHLNQGGLFIFDCWYGPCVLSRKPETRRKEIENDQIAVRRLATPIIHYNENVVDVHFEIDITKKCDSQQKRLNELHRMRYLFQPELKLFLEQAGLRIAHVEEWMTRKKADETTWGICVVAQKDIPSR